MFRKAFITSIFILLSFALFVLYQLFTTINLNYPYLLIIKKGSPFTKVLRKLEDDGFLSNTRFYTILADVIGIDQKIQAGEYEFNNTVSIYSILKKIISGDVIEHQFTILEGETISDIRFNLLINKDLTHTKKIAKEDNFNICGIRVTNPEGVFYPDTYNFNSSNTDKDILAKSLAKMNSYLCKKWNERGPNSPLKSAYEALILASIIEKESNDINEKPLVSSVFINRLHKRMRLQACSSVIYGLGSSYKGVLTNRHLAKKTKYNTYRFRGLPPTPICSPSKTSIDAAINPTITDYLYFVVDATGEHRFSKNFKKHVISANSYRNNRKYFRKIADRLYKFGKVRNTKRNKMKMGKK